MELQAAWEALYALPPAPEPLTDAEPIVQLEAQLSNTQIAFVEVYEQLLAVTEEGKHGKIYAELIRVGVRTLANVPERHRAELEVLLDVAE